MTRSRPRSAAATARRAGNVRPARRGVESRWLPIASLVRAGGWDIVLLGVLIVVAVRLGAFSWETDYPLTTPGGGGTSLPDTFASIDHVFHIAKEKAVLDALLDGDIPQWLPNHQAGYPAEFYPLGADTVVAAGWLLGFGQVPVEVIHKLVVIAVLFIPVIGYRVITRRDGLSPSIAVTASLLHLFIPGSWLGGGPDELLRMGMWPNVFATYLTLPLLLWGADFLRRFSRRGLILAAACGALAIYSNPRAIIGIATVLLAVGAVALAERRRRPEENTVDARTEMGRVALRLAFLGLVIGLLSASLLVPLRARQDLYEFAHFVEFQNAGEVWEFVRDTIPVEVFIAGVIGAAIALWRAPFHTRAVAAWLPAAMVTIATAGWLLRDLSIFSQLEGPRLLPVLRIPTLYLAAYALYTTVSWLASRIARSKRGLPAGIVTTGLTALFVLTPFSPLGDDERGLPPIETTNQRVFTEIASSVDAYERHATSTDRPLIIGSTLSEHATFWFPALADTNAFHGAWIWYWRTPDYADQTYLADVNAALEHQFLATHGLTKVVIAANATDILRTATAQPHLTPLEPASAGGYALFEINDSDGQRIGPVSISTGSVTGVDVQRERITATLQASEPAELHVAVNAYPAWRATVDGASVPIQRSPEGYMRIQIPAGASEVVLTYTVEPVVWVGRVLVALGTVLLVGALLLPVVQRRRTAEAQHPASVRVRYPAGRGGTEDHHGNGKRPR